VRNTVHSAQYGAQASAADLENQKLIEQATLAQAYFQIRGEDALVDILDQTVGADTQILELTRAQFELGITDEVAVVQAEQTLQLARVQRTNAALVRAQLEHAIATLIGVPATSFALPNRARLPAPPRIPTGAPSRLLERRPDIAGAERQMARANAAIGIATAAYYPSITLSANAGFASSALSTLVSLPSRVWSIGATLAETLFDAGARGAQVRAAVASYDAAVATYRQTVLTAFQQVEDALAGTALLAREVDEQSRAVALAQRALVLERGRVETGIDPYIDLMTQQTLLLSAQQTQVQLRVQQMTTAVQLVEALGGGWDRADLPSAAD
jgi:NodT family efflux transporter outer membrane factor (OMF) lipoprotein